MATVTEQIDDERRTMRAIEHAHVLAHAAHIMDQHIDQCAVILCERMRSDDLESGRATAGAAALTLIYLAEALLAELEIPTKRKKR